MPRAFCAYDGPGMSIKTVATTLSLRYGPQALKKILAMVGLGPKSSSSITWPAGKKVKIVFDEKDSGKRETLMWAPDNEFLHEIFMRAAPDTSIADFKVYYFDQDNDKVQLDTTKPSIESFLTEHSGDSRPKLQVEWRKPTTSEAIQIKVQEAKAWLTGEGGATDQDVKAQDKVEKSGGKVVVCSVSSGSGKSLVNHKGYDASKWKEAVPGLKAELGLTDAEEDALLNAEMREEGQAMHYREVQEGNKTTATFIAYHTVKRDDKINIIYGKHEESMEVSGAATSLPSENCVQYDGRTFAVWPPASPHSNVSGDDMKGLVAEIPSGWQLVQSSKQDFNLSNHHQTGGRAVWVALQFPSDRGQRGYVGWMVYEVYGIRLCWGVQVRYGFRLYQALGLHPLPHQRHEVAFFSSRPSRRRAPSW